MGFQKKIYEGPTPEGLIQDVMIKIMTGKRRWDPNNERLSTTIIRSVRSLISNLFKKEKARRALEKSEKQSQAKKSGKSLGTHIPASDICGNSYPTSNDIDVNSVKDTDERVLNVLFDMVKDDYVLIKYLKLKIENPSMRASKIAANIGVSRREVYNATRRLSRLVERKRKVFEEIRI